ncbi:hypothetical protein LTS17_009930 [Exophiala oligosperma]
MTLIIHQLSPNNEADLALIPAIARIHLAAWLTNGLYRTIYYGPPSSYPAINEYNEKRHLQSLKKDPTARLAVVWDDTVREKDRDSAGAGASTSTDGDRQPSPDQIIAWTKYNIFTTAEGAEERTDTGERLEWPAYTNLALVTGFWEALVKSREQNNQDIGAHVSVDQLATDPAHHRRGAGRMLMQHVAAQADALNLPVTLEASPQGMNVYRSVGFEPHHEFWVDLARFEDGGDKGEEWTEQRGRREGQGEGWYKEVAMVRAAPTTK